MKFLLWESSEEGTLRPLPKRWDRIDWFKFSIGNKLYGEKEKELAGEGEGEGEEEEEEEGEWEISKSLPSIPQWLSYLIADWLVEIISVVISLGKLSVGNNTSQEQPDQVGNNTK